MATWLFMTNLIFIKIIKLGMFSQCTWVFFLSFVLCAFKEHMGLPDGKLKTTIHLFKADARIYSHILGIIAKTAIKDAKKKALSTLN